MRKLKEDVLKPLKSTTMNRTFEEYMFMVGQRSQDYNYDKEVVLDNMAHFKSMWKADISPYKALLFLYDYLTEENQKWVNVGNMTPSHKDSVICIHEGLMIPAIYYDNPSFKGFYPFTSFYQNEREGNLYSKVDLDNKLIGVKEWHPFPKLPKNID